MVTYAYREALENVFEISFLEEIENVEHNCSYFPILVDAGKYGLTRDKLYKN